MKKFVKVLLSTFLCAGLVACGRTSNTTAMYIAGTYTGEAEGFGGTVTVTIETDESSIKNATVEGPNETESVGGAALEELAEQITAAQNAEIDGVSGATVTSTAAKEATAIAIGLAKNGGEASSSNASGTLVTGAYTATKMGNNGPITVSVTISDNRIDSIEVTESSETKGIGTTAIAQLTNEMINRQTVDVDSISSATVTSNAFKSAVKECIEEAGGVALLENVPAVENEVYQDCETQLVIIGAGGAGIMAAIHSSDLGIKSILLEKEGLIGGTTTMVGVGLNAGGTKIQTSTTIDDYYSHLEENGSTSDANGEDVEASTDYTRAFADNAYKAIDYLIDDGLPLKAIEDGGGNVGSHQLSDTTNGKLGEQLIELLTQKLEEAENTEVRVNNEATKILMEDGKVVGVEVDGANGSYTINTENVIIATGGYASSDTINEIYNPDKIGYNSTMAISSDGSGILLGQAAGGVVSDMQKMTIRQLSVGIPGVGGATYAHNTISSGEILVDGEGNRFVNEQASKNDLLAAINELDGFNCYIIADQTMVDNNANLTDLVKRGLMTQADSISDLAESLGLSVDNLISTVETFNNAVDEGVDLDFGREEMTTKIETGPYYGVQVRPSRHYCNGGLITNGKAEMLDEDRNVIPGLYAAGEVTWHSEHPASNALTFGWIAAETIAEKLS